MNTIRLTRNAQKWAEEKSVNSEIVTRAKDIALADHRGIPNLQDIQQAFSERPRK
jgi:hypothetical protein